jgi:uroporphyrinogen III methyltransferase/synthase
MILSSSSQACPNFYSKHRGMAKQRRSDLPRGKVFLVGAGPGDPGLITWRGVECLQEADLVLFDYLANPAILRHAAPAAELVCVGKHGRDRIWSQAEINQRLVGAASEGRRIVRLKGGDPAIFGRLAEEVEVLEAAGVEYEVVPGITAATAAGSYAGIWITQRDMASAVAIVTGHEGDSQHAPAIDYAALAKFPGTLVFYMGVTTAQEWSSALVAGGKPAETPVAIVRRCSWPDQTTLRCTLGTLMTELEAAKMRPPIVIVVGDVVGLAATESWFTRRPLFGKKILISRPIDRANSLYQPLAELGAECLIQPAIEVAPPTDWMPVDAVLARLDEFDWLVFSSVNGVQFLIDRLMQTGGDLRRFAGVQLAAIGPGTADELMKYHLRVDRQPPDVYRAEALADVLSPDAKGNRFLLARASRGREILAEKLQAAGGIIEQIVVYNSIDVAKPDAEISSAMSAGKIDWATVTSSAIARSLVRMFGDELRKTKLVSISPVTTATLRKLGFEPLAEAEIYTMAGVVDAIVKAT